MSVPKYLKPLLDFIVERHRIWERKSTGKPAPWTKDPILSKYRFCNVYRNLDKQTLLIHNNWLKRQPHDPDVWFAMAVARLVNWWPTLERIGYPVHWHTANERFVNVIQGLIDDGEKAFTGAYMIRADPHKDGGKAGYLADCVLEPMWRDRVKLRPVPGDHLEDFYNRLMPYRDMGSFMVGQIIADTKYADGPLLDAPDWSSFAVPGPGSYRGLARVIGITLQPKDRPRRVAWPTSENWFAHFEEVRRHMEIAVAQKAMPFLSGQDLQNCLCEFDKYERVRLGEGRPRSLYHPPKEQS